MNKIPVCSVCGSKDIWKYTITRKVYRYEPEHYDDDTSKLKWVRLQTTRTSKHKCKNDCTSRNRKGDIGYTTIKWENKIE